LIENANSANTHRRHAHEQVNHIFLIVGESVGVELLTDGWVVGFLFFVLVDNPFQGRAVAELILRATAKVDLR
jgi:hypothetical protein